MRTRNPGFYLAYLRAAAVFAALFVALDWIAFLIGGVWLPWPYAIAIGIIWPAIMTAIT